MAPSPRILALGAAFLAALASACSPATQRAPQAAAMRIRVVPVAAPAEAAPAEEGPADAAEGPSEVYSAARLEAAAALARRDFREAERLLAAEIERTGESDPLLGDLAQVRALAVLGAKAPGSAAFDLAVAALDRAIARQPGSARLFALRGAVAAKERRYADARSDFGRALALEPDDARLRLGAADLAAALRDFSAADREYRDALSMHPDHFDTWLARAIMLRARIDEGPPEGRRERYRAAHDALASAMSVDPSRIEVAYHFAVLVLDHGVLRAGEGIETTLLLGIELLRRFIEEAAQNPALAREVARAKQMYSDVQQATTCDFRQSAADRSAAELLARQRAAEEEAAGGGAVESP